MINSFAIKVFVIGGICKLLKQSGKVVFAEACCFCNLVKGKIFRAVFINIIADGKKTIQIFFLFLRSGIKTAVFKKKIRMQRPGICRSEKEYQACAHR
mgnify:CR=1 FL=1